eukprot:1157786-Pelagomonas_calceolata.AAC.2
MESELMITPFHLQAVPKKELDCKSGAWRCLSKSSTTSLERVGGAVSGICASDHSSVTAWGGDGDTRSWGCMAAAPAPASPAAPLEWLWLLSLGANVDLGEAVAADAA